MKVLVLGGGGREHAIVWKLSQSRNVEKIYCCPGNAGITSSAECLIVSPENTKALVDFARYEWIDLVLISSEDFLSKDTVSLFQREGCRVLGPDAAAFHLQSNRVFLKSFLKLHRIPSPEYKAFSSYLHAEDYIRLKGVPAVIKTDRHMSEKSIFMAEKAEEATHALKMIMKEKILGSAVEQIIIEEVSAGERLSFVFLTDGKDIRHLVTLRKKTTNELHSRTGSCVSLDGASTNNYAEIVTNTIAVPTLKAAASEGIKYKGILSLDVFIKDASASVFDLSCTFDHLDAQTALPLLKTDLWEILDAVSGEKLASLALEWREGVSVSAMIFSDNRNEKRVIKDPGEPGEDIYIFHENTSFENNDIVANGEQVLSITAVADNKEEAQKKLLSAIEKVSFKGMEYEVDVI